MNKIICTVEKIILYQFIICFVGYPLYAQEFDSLTTKQSELRGIVQAIKNVFQENIYDVAALDTPEFKSIENQIEELAKVSHTVDTFVKGFNDVWSRGSFSHVRIDHARMSADRLADFLDTMNVSRPGAVLTWNEEIAILTVYTMMGQNTIKQISDAYSEIIRRNAKALIIDLRKNEGGAFAVKPLVGHILSSNLESGVFMSQQWTSSGKAIPSQEIVRSLPAWDGWSIKSFWRDVRERGVLRIVFTPLKPNYTGPVYVLTSRRTASAAELAVDALVASGRGIHVGEKTAGKMLSQKIFDLPNNLQISLPIADYFAVHSGRIEGSGITPPIIIESEKAMNKAIEMARNLRTSDQN